MREPTFKKISLFAKIETKEDALKVIKDASSGFYFLAGLHIVLGILTSLGVIIDGISYGILAFLLRKFNSRVVAVVMLFLSCSALVLTGINRFGGGEGGRNILLAIIMIWVSIRAIEATFKYNKA